MRFTLAAFGASLLASTVAALDTIEVSDKRLVYSSSKKPFWVAGVDYQPGGSDKFASGSDPLSDVEACARDVFLFQQLGINTVRVYSVDPSVDHSGCMSLLARAGIYVILDVNSPLQGQNLNNHEPWTSYTPDYMQHIFEVMEAFACYDNTLGFFAGNEVIFDELSAQTSPNYIKAVVRDMKAYAKKHLSRTIPIGYSNADSLVYRTSFPAYLECGDEEETIDFLGVNSYQWCGDNTFEGSGYDKLVADYSNYSLPIIFSEYGCNVAPPRLFQETLAIYSTDMTGVFSGGMVYEYTQETNDFGLVQLSGSDGSAKTLADFTTYQKQLAKVDFDTVSIPSDAKNTARPATCPSESSATFSGITANLTLPASQATELINNGLSSSTACKGYVTKGLTTSSKYSITCNGKAVSDKEVKATEDVSSGSSSSSSSSESSSPSSSISSSTASSKASYTTSSVSSSTIVSSIGTISTGTPISGTGSNSTLSSGTFSNTTAPCNETTSSGSLYNGTATNWNGTSSGTATGCSCASGKVTTTIIRKKPTETSAVASATAPVATSGAYPASGSGSGSSSSGSGTAGEVSAGNSTSAAPSAATTTALTAPGSGAASLRGSAPTVAGGLAGLVAIIMFVL